MAKHHIEGLPYTDMLWKHSGHDFKHMWIKYKMQEVGAVPLYFGRAFRYLVADDSRNKEENIDVAVAMEASILSDWRAKGLCTAGCASMCRTDMPTCAHCLSGLSGEYMKHTCRPIAALVISWPRKYQVVKSQVRVSLHQRDVPII